MPIDFSSIFGNPEPDRPTGSFLDFSSIFEQERLRQKKLRELEEAKRLGAMQYQGIQENLGMGPAATTPLMHFQPENWLSSLAAGTADVGANIGSTVAGIAEPLSQMARPFSATAPAVLFGGPERAFSGARTPFDPIAEQARALQESASAGAEAIMPPDPHVGLRALRAAPLTGGVLAAGAIGGLPAAAAVGGLAQYGQAYAERTGRGIDPISAMMSAGPEATIVGAFDALGAESVLGQAWKEGPKALGQIAYRFAKGEVGEVSTEAAQEVTSMVAEALSGKYKSYDEFRADFVRRVPEVMKVAAILAGPTTGISTAAQYANRDQIQGGQGPEAFAPLNAGLAEQRAAGNIPEPNVEPIAPISNVPPVNPPTREEAPPVGPRRPYSPILFAEEPIPEAARRAAGAPGIPTMSASSEPIPVPGQSVGALAAQGTPRHNVPRGETAAATPGEPRRFGLALPELVELSKAIIGKVPQVSPKMREGVLGFFKGTPTEGKIKLRADLGKNPAQAAQTVAHELGHAADWADEHDLARGNVLGRLAKLKKSMVSVLNFPTGTLTEKIARQELEAVSRVMRPDLWQADPKSKTGKYVRNSRELYADAFSLLMHNPDEFSRLAPESSKAWWNHLDKAPNLKGTLEGFWQRASEGQGSILDAREAAMKEQHRQGAERLLAQARPEPKTLRQKLVAGRTAVLNLFYDKLSPLYRWKNQAAKKSPQAKEAVRQAIDAMNEVAYQGTADAAIIESTTKNLYDRVESEGIDKSDLSVYLAYRRMAGERAEFLNPGGIDKEAADQGLAHLEKRLGSDKIQKLREIWDDYFKSTRLPIIEDLVADTSHGEKLGEKALSNPEYVRFRPLKYIQEAGERGEGWALKLHKQLGTFEDIGDPVLETLLQDLAMSRFTARNKAAKAVKRAAELMGESEDATVYFDRSTNSMKAREPKKKDQGLVTYRQDGKEKGFYVPKEIAQTFERSPEILGKAGRALEAVVGNKIIRNILVVMQPAFAAVQAIKDPMTAIRNAPGSNPLKFARAFGSAAKDLAPVFLQHLKGESPGLTPDEVEARLHRAIISPGQMISATFGTEGENVHDAAFAAFAARAGLSEKAHQMMVQKPLAKLMDRAKEILKSAGEFENRWVKLAGWKYLKQNYGDMPASQRAAIIRERWGNPDPYRAGSAKAIYDALSLFSNVSKEGLRSTVESFKDNPGAYTLKSVAMHMVPAVIGAMIKHGFFDDDEEKKKGVAASDIVKKASTYVRTNYIAAPLGMASNGEGALLTIPLDYVGAMIHSITYRVADRLLSDEKEKAEKTGIVGDTLKAFIGMLPFADLSPTLESAGMLTKYAAGGVPRDTYRDQDVLSPNEAAARGSWPVTKKVLKAAWNNSFSTMLEFETDILRSEVNGDVKSVMGFGAKSLPILGRFIRFTNAGDKEAEYRAEAADRAEKAPGFIQLDIEIAKLQHGNPNLSPYEGMKALRLRGLTPGKDFVQRWNRIKQKPGLQ